MKYALLVCDVPDSWQDLATEQKKRALHGEHHSVATAPCGTGPSNRCCCIMRSPSADLVETGRLQRQLAIRRDELLARTIHQERYMETFG